MQQLVLFLQEGKTSTNNGDDIVAGAAADGNDNPQIPILCTEKKSVFLLAKFCVLIHCRERVL